MPRVDNNNNIITALLTSTGSQPYSTSSNSSQSFDPNVNPIDWINGQNISNRDKKELLYKAALEDVRRTEPEKENSDWDLAEAIDQRIYNWQDPNQGGKQLNLNENAQEGEGNNATHDGNNNYFNGEDLRNDLYGRRDGLEIAGDVINEGEKAFGKGLKELTKDVPILKDVLGNTDANAVGTDLALDTGIDLASAGLAATGVGAIPAAILQGLKVGKNVLQSLSGFDKAVKRSTGDYTNRVTGDVEHNDNPGAAAADLTLNALPIALSAVAPVGGVSGITKSLGKAAGAESNGLKATTRLLNQGEKTLANESSEINKVINNLDEVTGSSVLKALGKEENKNLDSWLSNLAEKSKSFNNGEETFKTYLRSNASNEANELPDEVVNTITKKYFGTETLSPNQQAANIVKDTEKKLSEKEAAKTLTNTERERIEQEADDAIKALTETSESEVADPLLNKLQNVETNRGILSTIKDIKDNIVGNISKGNQVGQLVNVQGNTAGKYAQALGGFVPESLEESVSNYINLLKSGDDTNKIIASFMPKEIKDVATRVIGSTDNSNNLNVLFRNNKFNKEIARLSNKASTPEDALKNILDSKQKVTYNRLVGKGPSNMSNNLKDVGLLAGPSFVLPRNTGYVFNAAPSLIWEKFIAPRSTHAMQNASRVLQGTENLGNLSQKGANLFDKFANNHEKIARSDVLTSAVTHTSTNEKRKPAAKSNKQYVQTLAKLQRKGKH